MDKQLFYDLVTRYLDGSATDDEKLLVESYYEQLSSENSPMSDEKMQLLRDAIYRNINETIHPSAKIIPLRKRTWWRITEAAVIIFALSGTIWLTVFQDKKPRQAGIAENNLYKSDINPAKGGATLLLGDGSAVYLDNTANGKLAINNANITKANDRLLYSNSNNTSYNTLKTGKGKSYQLTLADGTQVWLDAMSSIRYPTAFNGADREVEITGQAYFEVMHNAKQPFKVKVNDKTVEVLGTHFNVDAFGPFMKTTLLEGAVKVLNNEQVVFIKPGEQAIAASGISVERSVDLDEVMAWKNGRFKFTGNTIEEIFNVLSRWYDIDVTYEDKINEEFVANISRDVPISKVLTLFEYTKQIKFKIEDKKIIVMK